MRQGEGKMKMLDNIKETAGNELSRITAKRNRPGITQELSNLIKERRQAVIALDVEKARSTNKQIQQQRKKEKKEQR